MSSPTARSLALLRASGYVADVVERWLPRVNVRRDLFHCINLVAVRRGVPGVLAIQTTSRSNVGARLKKSKARPELAIWLATGNTFEVHGWYHRGDRWDCVRVGIQAGDLADVILQAPPRRRRRKGERQRELFA